MTDHFDEGAYLAAHQDVRAAVIGGAFGSGRAHYEAFGRAEGRSMSPQETRDGRILAGLDLATMSGIEIGALTAPLVRPAQGRITYVDHAATDDLIRKYKDNPKINPADIVEVGAIWGDNTLRQALGGNELYDYVLASHVVEHVPDLVTWLEEIHAVLKSSGSLRLYIPDKRFDFDHLRVEAQLADVLDAWLRKARSPLPRMILDHHINFEEIDIRDAWDGRRAAGRDWQGACRGAIRIARDALATGSYSDAHCWVVTPRSFATLMAQCAELGLVKFACQRFVDTRMLELEFLIIMVPCDDPVRAAASWRAMADAAAQHP